MTIQWSLSAQAAKGKDEGSDKFKPSIWFTVKGFTTKDQSGNSSDRQRRQHPPDAGHFRLAHRAVCRPFRSC
jgi:hypothetical protein